MIKKDFGFDKFLSHSPLNSVFDTKTPILKNIRYLNVLENTDKSIGYK
jgi:hypothetical protein